MDQKRTPAGKAGASNRLGAESENNSAKLPNNQTDADRVWAGFIQMLKNIGASDALQFGCEHAFWRAAHDRRGTA